MEDEYTSITGRKAVMLDPNSEVPIVWYALYVQKPVLAQQQPANILVGEEIVIQKWKVATTGSTVPIEKAENVIIVDQRG